MENTAVEAAVLAGSVGRGFSMWDLFVEADIVVKLVLLVLAVASFWSWAIIIDKVLRVRRLRDRANRFEESFWSGGALEELYDEIGDQPSDPMSAIFVAAMREWRRFTARGGSLDQDGGRALKDRVERVMGITIGREMDRLETSMIFLASVGSAAPFIGLFGTVWGIMNSFFSIAATANTSLAIVAPGIAEALFATALGLVAAIPATIGFNKLNNEIGRYGQRLEAFAGEFGAILSRQLEERH